jgi:UDPglucose--hexose-1-phosphate uridylyltransferase
MAGTPSGPSPVPRSADDLKSGRVDADRSPEPNGPVAIDRHRKDDGRALTLYTRADSGSPAGAATAEPAPEPHAPAHRSASELRFNELRGEEVVYAIHRQDRTFLPAEDHCPLDPTHPGGPPTEIPFPSFEIAVFDNLFPAFQAPHGAAEVVVYTDDHHGSFAGLAPERAEALMWVWRHRYEQLGARADVEYVMIFENRGVEVGVTLHHPHGQIYAYPFLPPVPALELDADARLGGCAPCSLLKRELDERVRIVHENDAVVAFVPLAARWAYETHVVLREHRPSLIDCSPSELTMLAASLQAVARGFDALFDRPFPYIMIVHQAPTGADGASGHLHVEFYPPLRTGEKLKYLAGSEQGAGTFISDTLPEESAAILARAIASVL